MKKIFATLLVMFTIVSVSFAQPRAIGGRLGYNLEFSYQHTLSNNMMTDLTIGATNVWNGWAYIDATAMFDWVFNISDGWNWYVGPGVGVGVGVGRWWRENNYMPFRLNVGGQIGIEYQFGAPVNLSLDWRPMLNVLGVNHGYGWYNGLLSLALGVRYRF